MNHHPIIIESFVDEKLSALRAEGMRSQMTAHAGAQKHGPALLPGLRRFFQQTLAGLVHSALQRLDQPATRNGLAQSDPCD